METNLNATDALKHARCLLSRIAAQTHKKNNQAEEELSNDTILSEKTLISCMAMAQSFHSMNMGGLSVADCSVVRAIIELIVRWGISPFLSPGVGIARKWKPSQIQTPSLTVKNMTIGDEGLLLRSCKMLSSFAIGGHNVGFSSNGFCVSLIVRNYYLADVMAGFLQVAFAPAENDEKTRNIAVCKIEEMVAAMEVGDMVETFLTLVGGQSKRDKDYIPPPQWLTAHAGKFLSTLVMKEGGVAAVMQNLLGPGVKGDVQVYNNVAAHLAKVPNYIANHELYYQAVCVQILPFLSYQKPAKKQALEGENVQQVLRNMHHTSSLLACNMIVREPGLSETYILKPILVHLVKWYKLQTVKSFPDSDNSWNEGKEQEVTETLILQSFMQLHALLTAGHKDSNNVKKEFLEKTRPVFPAMMMLHYLLETSATSKPFWDRDFCKETKLGPHKTKQADKKGPHKNEEGKVKQIKTSLKEKREKSTGFKIAFLDGYVSQASDEEEDCSTLGRLKVIITDFMIAHISEFSEDWTHLLLSFLFDLDVEKFTWPSTEGDIWTALNPNISRLHTPAEYLARLLLDCEKWSLVVKLMNDIFWKVFNLRQSLKIQLLHEVNNEDFSPLTSVLNMVQSFETLNEVVGLKAFEYDLAAAAKLVQDLLLEPTLLNDEDMVELVLHMVHSVLNGFGSRLSGGGLEQHEKETLTCMSASLERICKSQSSSQNLKRMSSTLNARICSFVVS